MSTKRKNNVWQKNEPSTQPKESKYYLVYFPDPAVIKIHIAKFSVGDRRWEDPLDFQWSGKMSHWQALPDEPKD